ncbi:MAG: 4'-phosphopantetheinyl transferase superfamily protein [Caulobacteraceae bacterium]|nr:4'-phosphopantetheinyl transferase superfamily protein [Caulobacteraceae bacterium]
MTALLPPLPAECFAVAEGLIGEIDGDAWPEEAEEVRKAVPPRQDEFHAGRTLARRALAALGGPPAAILRGEAGAPLWPPGFTGSITHTGKAACAVAARSTEVLSVGIDLEQHARFHPELERRVLTASETKALAGLDAGSRRFRLALAFSAKEAFYKMQFPLTGRRLGFHDAAVAQSGDVEGIFELTLLASAPPLARSSRFQGLWRLSGEFVAAAIWLPAEGCGAKSRTSRRSSAFRWSSVIRAP